MNTVLMYVIMGLVCRFKAPGGGFRNLKFDLLYKYIYTHKDLQVQAQVAQAHYEKSAYIKPVLFCIYYDLDKM